MAEVWRARHADDGVPVAVKVLTARGGTDPTLVHGFNSEIRAVAGLDHLRIVRIHDQGTVPESAAGLSEGRLKAGVPYLVMELAEGGTLIPCLGKTEWPEIKRILMGVLDALAHAHARGVIHRDIKPGNVLLSASGCVKLTDFGLAHALDRAGGGRLDTGFVGTPKYMAPEQLDCRWRDYGPWTDLYAVGCLAFALAAGRSPFDAPTVPAVMHKHMVEGPALLVPARPVPDGFRPWLATLLQRSAGQRYRRAMDAAWALAQIRLPGSPSDRSLQDVETIGWREHADPLAGDAPRATGFLHPVVPVKTDPSWPRDPKVPPFPQDWRRPDRRERGHHLSGVGLTMFGLRSVGIVGRERERERLWAALARVRSSSRAEMVLLEGPSGCGKTRLARWLGERAHETGAATVFSATHGPTPGPEDGLGPMLSRHLRCGGLDRRALITRLIVKLESEERGAGEDEAPGLVQLVHPAVGDDQRTVRFGGSIERYAVVRRFLERAARERPVVVLLDDLQFGADALGFAAHVLLAQGVVPCPILLIGTVQAEGLVDRPRERELLEELASFAELESIPVGPLEPAQRSILVRELLGLEAALAARVEERTGGNPLFATQLVGQWVESGLLEPGPRGFELVAGSRVDLPTDMRMVWIGRIEGLLRGEPSASGPALELAAVLGQDVLSAEWRTACEHAGVRPFPEALAERLLVRALARPHPDGDDLGWSFVHGMLREALLARALAAGRLEAHHRACAAMVAADLHRANKARLGRHLLASGAVREALDPMEASVGIALHDGEIQRAAMHLEELAEAVTRLEPEPSDPVFAVLSELSARVARRSGDVDGAVQHADEGLRLAQAHGHERLLPRLLLNRGNALVSAGRLEEARPLYEQGLERAVGEGDLPRAAAAWRQLAYLELCEGKLEASRAASRRAIVHHESIGDGMGVANSYRLLAQVSTHEGDLERASFELEESRSRFERLSARWGVATCANNLGDLARKRSRVEDAEGLYRDAAATYRAIGSGDHVYPTLNLALLLVDEQRFTEALDLADQARLEFERQGRPAMVAASAAVLLPCLAATERWERFDVELDRCARGLRETGFVEPDIARVTALAGTLAEDLGEPKRGAEAKAIACAQRAALGND